ncbi:MAG: amidohydrolase [Methylotenera sp.]|nr:amidohydrolase [Methylotenera sp.]
MNRRQFLYGLGLLGLSGAGYAGLEFWPENGLSNPCLTKLPDEIKQHPLMQEIWRDIRPELVWDTHVHLVGTGDSDSGIWSSPNMDSYWHPILKVQKNFYMNGSCAVDGDIDNSTVQRMLTQLNEIPAGFKLMLFAFDWFHDENGKPNKDQSIFHIPNQYAQKIASENANRFEWVCSIHPYRADAVDALELAHAQGARAVKWLPSGMGIDPASPKCDLFYQKLQSLNMPIISHTGAESAVQGGVQAHGNPLRTRRALDAGVRVVLAHCASDGFDEDLDNSNKRIKSFDLFARLMDTPDYQQLVFGEISALTLINHAWAIKPILQRTDWHHRLLNGSDYPLPGILPLINTQSLAKQGLLNMEYVPFLQALKNHNALLFDFAVKRLIALDGIKFANSVFETKSFFKISQ